MDMNRLVDKFDFGECGGGRWFDGSLNSSIHAFVGKLLIDCLDGVVDVSILGSHAEGQTLTVGTEELSPFNFCIFPDAGQRLLGGSTDVNEGFFVVGGRGNGVAPDSLAQRLEDDSL
jgi:hypothetical protein